jgi:two-component system phosphate regulon sensor histidine kinase PhoR
MNDGLFSRDLFGGDDAWSGVGSAGLGRGAPFRIAVGSAAAAPGPVGLPAPFAAPHDQAHLIRALRERLRDAESELGSANAILALHPEPILVIDDSRAILRGNAAARTLFHGDADGRGAGAMLDHKEVIQAAAAVFAGRGRQAVDVKLSGPTDRHLRARIELLPADIVEKGHAARPTALLTVTDLTEVKRAEQLRADFVANASHELRTPLSVLLGFIETLTGPAADDQAAQREFLGIMQQQATRMARLVDDLLSLSKIELTEHAAPTRRVQVAEVVGPIARALDLRAAERGMAIELVVAPGLPAVPGEPDELAQLVQNLIDNAIKYARPGTAITVTVAPSPRLAHGVMVRVRDRGEGIAKRHLARLTERFYRVDKARSSGMSGTGLGLAIVKHVVNRHNGLLEIESKVGRGSRFTVHLPNGPSSGGSFSGRPVCN